jgi:hypothetical protein
MGNYSNLSLLFVQDDEHQGQDLAFAVKDESDSLKT